MNEIVEIIRGGVSAEGDKEVIVKFSDDHEMQFLVTNLSDEEYKSRALYTRYSENKSLNIHETM